MVSESFLFLVPSSGTRTALLFRSQQALAELVMSAIHLNTLHASSLPIQLEREDAEDLYFSQLPGGGTPSPLPTANPTKSFWTHGEPGCNPLATEGSKGALSEDADIVVIGSGITGVSAAYHLKRLLMKEGGGGQTKVVMLEARDFCK